MSQVSCQVFFEADLQLTFQVIFPSHQLLSAGSFDRNSRFNVSRIIVRLFTRSDTWFMVSENKRARNFMQISFLASPANYFRLGRYLPKTWCFQIICIFIICGETYYRKIDGITVDLIPNSIWLNKWTSHFRIQRPWNPDSWTNHCFSWYRLVKK